MFEVNGFSFSQRVDYEAALRDKKKIDQLKAQYDMRTPSGVEAISKELMGISFESKLGVAFDDEIFELKQEYKKVRSEVVKEKVTPTEKKKKEKQNEDLPQMDEKTRKAVQKELKKQNTIRNAVVVVLILVSASCLLYFAKYFVDAQKAAKNAQQWAELRENPSPEFISVSVAPIIRKDYSDEVEIPEILDEYKILYNKNKSLIGWIKIADTNIDYPVMQTVNNEYYLKHNFDQKEDANGCIFMDCNNDVILGNTNYILYGHHMNSGKMFSSIVKYGNQDYYEKHKYIQFDTIYRKGTYEVMYAFRTHIYGADEITFKYYQFIDANSEMEFDSAMEEMAKMSIIETGVTASFGDELLTLSTCDYQEENGRFAVVAKRID